MGIGRAMLNPASCLLLVSLLISSSRAAPPALDLTARLGDREVDLTPVRIRLDIVPFNSEDKPEAGGLFSTYRQVVNEFRWPDGMAVYAGRSREGADVDRLAGLLPSLDLITWKAKCRDDAMYAGLELALQQGHIVPPGKARLLEIMLERLLRLRQRTPGAAADAACAYIAAGIMAGDGDPAVPAEIGAMARRMLDALRSQPVWVKPNGFYTWTPELRRLFSQDRLFQMWPARLDPYTSALTADDARIALILAQSLRPIGNTGPDLRDAYRRTVEFYRAMTNPNRHASLVEVQRAAREAGSTLRPEADAERAAAQLSRAGWDGIALFPHSLSRESRVVAELGGDPAAPTMGGFMASIENGEVSLQPTDDSGHYDRQQYALETLLFPGRAEESHKVVEAPEYRQRLREAFAALVTSFRETHI
ncbi:MAG: hypothetical protein JSV65_16630, partial [Armatimonadota bacterium]